MSRPRYQVFVSSTFSDLHDERQAVTWEILKLRHIPAGMENFPATDDRGWKIIQRTIDDSDYYVLLIAGRYGSIDETTGISWTEREYDYARSKGIPVLAFVRDKGSIMVTKADGDEKARKLTAFIEKIDAAHLRSPWSTKEDLAVKVVQAISRAIQEDEDDEKPRSGWIRGGTGSAEVVKELARLSKENAELREQLVAIGASKKAILELTFDGQHGADLEQEIPLIEIDPNGPRKKSQMVRVKDLKDRVSRTMWLRGWLRNTGNSVARRIKIEYQIDTPVLEIDLNRTKIKYDYPIANSAGTPWYLNPSETVYVSRESHNEAEAYVEQRVKSVGVGQQEKLVSIGLVLPDGELQMSGYLNFTIGYTATSEEGEQVQGFLSVKLRMSAPTMLSADDLLDEA